MLLMDPAPPWSEHTLGSESSTWQARWTPILQGGQAGGPQNLPSSTQLTPAAGAPTLDGVVGDGASLSEETGSTGSQSEPGDPGH